MGTLVLWKPDAQLREPQAAARDNKLLGLHVALAADLVMKAQCYGTGGALIGAFLPTACIGDLYGTSRGMQALGVPSEVVQAHLRHGDKSQRRVFYRLYTLLDGTLLAQAGP